MIFLILQFAETDRCASDHCLVSKDGVSDKKGNGKKKNKLKETGNEKEKLKCLTAVASI